MCVDVMLYPHKALGPVLVHSSVVLRENKEDDVIRSTLLASRARLTSQLHALPKCELFNYCR